MLGWLERAWRASVGDRQTTALINCEVQVVARGTMKFLLRHHVWNARNYPAVMRTSDSAHVVTASQWHSPPLNRVP